MFFLLYIIIILMAIFNFLLLRRNRYLHERGSFWHVKWIDQLDENLRQSINLDQLEIGTQEIEENYQQELLSEYDKIDSLKRMLSNLEEELDLHDSYCLPNLCDDIVDANPDEPTPIFDSVHRDPVLF